MIRPIPRRPLKTWAAILACLAGLPVGTPASASVELHAHLFMEQAMSWFFRGDFEGPLQAKDWKSRFSSQANPETVERSGIRILVVSLYAHPLMSLSMRESVRTQIAHAEAFVTAHPGWVIAKSPGEARAALKSGRRVLVLSLEGALGVVEDSEDILEFVEERGVRLITPLHLTDDRFGGAAFLRGILKIANPIAWVRNLFQPIEREGVMINDRGLTDRGRELARRLIAAGAWLDLSHASDRSQDELIPMIREAGHPLLYTHTVLRSYHGAERGISEAQLKQVAESNGIIGLMPSEEYLVGTPAEESTGCQEGVALLARQYRELVARIGESQVALGSDYNGGVIHLKPGCAPGTALENEGLWNIGQAEEVWRTLLLRGAASPEARRLQEEAFLLAWERVLPEKNEAQRD